MNGEGCELFIDEDAVTIASEFQLPARSALFGGRIFYAFTEIIPL